MIIGTVHEVTPATTVSVAQAEQIARVMGALSTASRVRILACLRESACTVGDLTSALGMEQPAVSHQLRILRDLRLVVGSRVGRNVLYGLHDSHVASLVDEALRHMEHLQGQTAQLPQRQLTPPERQVMTDAPHTHEHAHDELTHTHAHIGHDHAHVEHDHEHTHDGETHAHDHAHEAGLEEVHQHAS